MNFLFTENKKFGMMKGKKRGAISRDEEYNLWHYIIIPKYMFLKDTEF